MRSTLLFIITALIVLAFAAYWSTYTVRFTEVAVVTTFGRAGENAIRDGSAGQAGLYLKWPYPIQSVTKYDTRTRFLQTRGETQQTADQKQIVVESFLAWRVKDPLVFYERYSSSGPDARDHFKAAERTLESLLRAAMSEVSRFELGQLFDPRPGESRLGDLEQAVAARLRRDDSAAGRQIAEYGVEPVLVGVNRIVLPQETTKAVFDRMKANRERLAGEAQTRGESLATTIKNEAESAASRIRAFADQRAAEIRNLGDLEAARYIKEYNEEPELAIFLKELDLLRTGLGGKKTTLVLPTTLPGIRLFDPAQAPSDGKIPPFSSPPPPARASAQPASPAQPNPGKSQ